MSRHGSLLVLCALGVAACGPKTYTRRLVPADDLAAARPTPSFLKAHMRNGDVVVFSAYEVSDDRRVRGPARRLDANRVLIADGDLAVEIDSVAVFEADRIATSGAVAPLAVLTVATAGMAVFCLTNTKACFGSCPTFYGAVGDSAALLAEGFSTSIAPSLEAADLDHLYRLRPRGRTVEITMRNEAPETHVIRYAHLIAARRALGSRVFAEPDGRFRIAEAVVPLTACASSEGSCLASVEAVDQREWQSRADSTDLAARETVDLSFVVPDSGEYGLVIGSRQSLLPTYLLYQGLAYLGSHVGEWLAALERGDARARAAAGGFGEVLGGIEVLLPDSAGDRAVSTVMESGPLAVDYKLIPLGRRGPGPLDLTLRLTRGMWRIEYLALARLGGRPATRRIRPTAVLDRNGRPDADALRRLQDTVSALTTTRGDSYTLRFELPGSAEQYELFLASRGYYLEWMRSEWLAEENPLRAARMLLDPRGMLRELAPAFTRAEPVLEDAFWRSRYVQH
jgi:hypothetical protein